MAPRHGTNLHQETTDEHAARPHGEVAAEVAAEAGTQTGAQTGAEAVAPDPTADAAGPL